MHAIHSLTWDSTTHLQCNWARVFSIFQKMLTGGIIMSQIALCRNFGGKGGGGGTFEGGILMGHYDTLTSHRYYCKFSAFNKVHIWSVYTSRCAICAQMLLQMDNLLTKEEAISHPLLKHVLNVDNWLRVWDCAIDRGCAWTIAVQNALRFLSKPILLIEHARNVSVQLNQITQPHPTHLWPVFCWSAIPTSCYI